MHYDDGSQDEIVEELRESLRCLDNLRLVPHNDLHVLHLKQHMREKIAELEGGDMYLPKAA